MKLACLMMQKNEGALLEAWIGYHSTIFGPSNIYIYDNGSQDLHTLEVLKNAETAGVNVDYQHNTRAHFENKGNILANKIHQLQTSDSYDFFFPLDGDEFIATQLQDNTVSTSLDHLVECLAAYRHSKDVLMIKSEYNNNPMARDYYKPRSVQRKCFFASGACASLDMGYHRGRAVDSELEVKTPVIYVHFHNKIYEEYQRSAREKLQGRVKDFSHESLIEHLQDRKIGFHVIPALLQSQSDYEQGFPLEDHVYIPAVRQLASQTSSSRFFEKFKILSTPGLVESIDRVNGQIEISGWATTPSGDRVDSIKVLKDANRVTGIKVEYISRIDVQRAGFAKHENSGFKVTIYEHHEFISDFQVLAVIQGEDRSLSK